MPLLALALLVSSCADGPPPPSGCTADRECPFGRCVDRRCVSIDAGTTPLPDAGCTCTAGQLCTATGCIDECANPEAIGCSSPDVCDVISGRCATPGTPGVLTGPPETCGTSTCLPGSECGLAGTCVPSPPCAAVRCTDDSSVCWGSACASERPIADCTPAPLETMNGQFRMNLMDLELDDACYAYGVTTRDGADALRILAPDGILSGVLGVANLNMGEVAVLRPYETEFETKPGEVAITYVCCAACGCAATVQQGVARLDRTTMTLPIVIPARTTSGVGPLGTTVLDTGPYGLTWGKDRTLYVGNTATNGPFVRLDLVTSTQTTVREFETRVYASAVYDESSLLVAIHPDVIMHVSNDGMDAVELARAAGMVVGMVRDPFLGIIYVADTTGVYAIDRHGTRVRDFEAMPLSRGRVAYSPDGALYFLPVRPAGVIRRFDLPTTL